MKIKLLIINLILLAFYPVAGLDNCQLEFNYRIEKSDSNRNKIYLTLMNGNPESEYSLWNLSLNQKINVIQKKLSPNRETLMFEDVPEGDYVINVKANGCKYHYSIGGLKGIEIK
ncbi:MAG: hypothetical protein ACOCVN_01060 [bacterium]